MIEVDGQDVTAAVQTNDDGSRVWDHNYLTFIIPDPSQGSSAKTLVVTVGGQRSAPRTFRKPVPNINALATQGVWKGECAVCSLACALLSPCATLVDAALHLPCCLTYPYRYCDILTLVP